MKSKFIPLILTSVIVGSTLIWYIQREPYSTEKVIDSVLEKYPVQSTQIGYTDPTIWIEVYNKADIKKVEKYLTENLSKDDLDHYGIEVYAYKE